MNRKSIRIVTITGAACLLAATLNAQVNLGTASTFSVLGGSTVTNTGPTVITGKLGVAPGSAVTGFPPGVVTGGAIHAADATAAHAQSDLTAAYNTAAGTPCNADLTGQDLGGKVLTPGVYCFASSAALTGTLTLNMLNDPNAVFLFKIGSTLTTASGSSVLLVNSGGAGCATNLNWQVGSSATFGTGSAFKGNVLALTSITATTGSNVDGRLLARNGAVTLDSNTITLCNAFVPPGGPPPGGEPVGGPTLGPAGMVLLLLLLVGAGLLVMNRLSI
jgi:type VI secretion system secreted protein VgrG